MAKKKRNRSQKPCLTAKSNRGRKVNGKTKVTMKLSTLRRMLTAARKGKTATAKVRAR